MRARSQYSRISAGESATAGGLYAERWADHCCKSCRHRYTGSILRVPIRVEMLFEACRVAVKDTGLRIRLVAVLAHDLKVQKILCGVEASAVDAWVTEEVTQALHRHVRILRWCNCMLAHTFKILASSSDAILFTRVSGTHPMAPVQHQWLMGPAWVRLRVSFPSFFPFFFFLPLPFLFLFPSFFARFELGKGSNKAEQKIPTRP